MRDFFVTDAPVKLRLFVSLQPVAELESLSLVAMTAENRELQINYEDLGSEVGFWI